MTANQHGSFAGQVAFVTGAATGIGRAAALTFAHEGASEAQPPRRFIAGADAISIAEQKIANLQAAINAYPELSTSLAYHA